MNKKRVPDRPRVEGMKNDGEAKKDCPHGIGEKAFVFNKG